MIFRHEIILNFCLTFISRFAGRQRFPFLDYIYFVLNGAIFVDRKDKESGLVSKRLMIEYLKKGRSIFIFPECSWNLTDAQLILPMKWGIIDVAQQADAQIIPIALDYDRKLNECRVRFGSPLVFNASTNKADAIKTLRDTMATLLWELIENTPVLCRANLDAETMRKEMYCALQEYPCYDFEYEQSILFKPYVQPSEVFAHLKAIELTKDNAFLFSRY